VASFDLLLRGANVYPGEGAPVLTDVGVRDGVIAAVGDLAAAEAAEVVDGAGAMLCPGLIDLHAHSALVSFSDPLHTPKILQGFTTEVINPDGLAPAPVAPGRQAARQAYLRALEGEGPPEWPWTTFAEYLEALDRSRPALSLVPSVAHGAVREAVIGADRVAPTAAQLAEMRRLVRLGLEAGARMLSFGLVYIPGAYAETDELVAVAEEAAAFGVPLVPHVRNEGAGLLEAVGELIEVARRSGAPLHLSHLKSLSGDHLIDPLLALIDGAAADIDLTFDQYPYGAGATLLASLLPAWAQAGGAEQTLERAQDTGERAAITRDIRDGLPGWENILGTLGPDRIVVEGRPLSEIAEERGIDAVATVLDLLVESSLAVGMVLHYASDDAVRTIAAHPLQLVGSDGIYGESSHPRLYGTAPRFLGRFTIREGLIPVEEAVARLTARAADRLGLPDRGRIEAGKRADLVLLDPELYVDTATYADPRQSPPGVLGVWVAGVAVVRDGVPTGARPGGVATFLA
jgi:N-acyl-D-amino-acid deacylase